MKLIKESKITVKKKKKNDGCILGDPVAGVDTFNTLTDVGSAPSGPLGGMAESFDVDDTLVMPYIARVKVIVNNDKDKKEITDTFKGDVRSIEKGNNAEVAIIDITKESFPKLQEYRSKHDSPYRVIMGFVPSKLVEAKTSRIYQHIVSDNSWAIVSPYLSVSLSADEMQSMTPDEIKKFYKDIEKQNKVNMINLKRDVRSLDLGFIPFISRWVSEDGEVYDEEALLIPDISYEQAMNLGKKYKQYSIIVHKDNGVFEVATRDKDTKKIGDTVREFDISGDKPLNINLAKEILAGRKMGPTSLPTREKNKELKRPFTLMQMHESRIPKPSSFHENYDWVKIWDRDENTND